MYEEKKHNFKTIVIAYVLSLTNCYVSVPPEIHSLQYTKVIEGHFFNTFCNVTLGNPQDTTIKWSTSEDDLVSNTSDLCISNISRAKETWYICSANNVMMPTFGTEVEGSTRRSFYLEVLCMYYCMPLALLNTKRAFRNKEFIFCSPILSLIILQYHYSTLSQCTFFYFAIDPPEDMNVSLTMINVNENHIVSNLSLIENKSELIVFDCSAKGNPNPTNYMWSGIKGNSSSVLVLNVSREVGGNYTCSAGNLMIPSNGTAQTGYINQTYAVDILCKCISQNL